MLQLPKSRIRGVKATNNLVYVRRNTNQKRRTSRLTIAVFMIAFVNGRRRKKTGGLQNEYKFLSVPSCLGNAILAKNNDPCMLRLSLSLWLALRCQCFPFCVEQSRTERSPFHIYIISPTQHNTILTFLHLHCRPQYQHLREAVLTRSAQK